MAQMIKFFIADTLENLEEQVNEWFKLRPGLRTQKVNWKQNQAGSYIMMLHYIQSEPEVC